MAQVVHHHQLNFMEFKLEQSNLQFYIITQLRFTMHKVILDSRRIEVLKIQTHNKNGNSMINIKSLDTKNGIFSLQLASCKGQKIIFRFWGGHRIEHKVIITHCKQIPTFITSFDSPTRHLTKEFWLPPTIARQHFCNHPILALKVI